MMTSMSTGMYASYICSHVILDQELYKYMRSVKMDNRLLSESEWRSLGVGQSLGWEHYAVHKPEPNVLLFRRHKSMVPPQ